jgi:hypothetical protein
MESGIPWRPLMSTSGRWVPLAHTLIGIKVVRFGWPGWSDFLICTIGSSALALPIPRVMETASILKLDYLTLIQFNRLDLRQVG